MKLIKIMQSAWVLLLISLGIFTGYETITIEPYLFQGKTNCVMNYITGSFCLCYFGTAFLSFDDFYRQ